MRGFYRNRDDGWCCDFCNKPPGLCTHWSSVDLDNALRAMLEIDPDFDPAPFHFAIRQQLEREARVNYESRFMYKYPQKNYSFEIAPAFNLPRDKDCDHRFSTSSSKGEHCSGCKTPLKRCRYKDCGRHAFAPWVKAPNTPHPFELDYCRDHAESKKKLESGPGIKINPPPTTCSVGADWEN